jgi:streptogramin lyase
MENMRRRYGLLVAIVSAIIIPIVFLGIIGNNDGNPSYLSLLNSGGIQNQNDTTQQIDDTFLRGAVDANSVGKQVSEKIKRHLCGSSLFAESTEFIQEYQIPFACAQPVGIAVDSQDLVWVAATWTGHLLVFDPTSERFVKFRDPKLENQI